MTTRHPTAEHLQRGALVYVRQSTMKQVREHIEGKRRQYELVDRARKLGFASVDVIDDDLGKSGSGLQERPGFQRLVAAVCAVTHQRSTEELRLVSCDLAARRWTWPDARSGMKPTLVSA